MNAKELTLVFLDPEFPQGRVVDPGVPSLFVTDLGTARGDGVFETLLAVDAQPRKIKAHLSRLVASAEALDLRIPPRSAWEAAVAHGIEEHGRTYGVQASDRLMLRLVATRGVESHLAQDGRIRPTCWVQVSPATTPRREEAKPIKVLTLDRGYDSGIAERAPWLLVGAKTLSYAVNMAALRHAARNGADDVIFVTSDGKLLEGPTSTVLLAKVDVNGRRILSTPERRTGILPGTTQSAMFELAEQAGWELAYGPLEVSALAEADAVWLVSSVRLVASVSHVDGQKIIKDQELVDELTQDMWDLAEKIH